MKKGLNKLPAWCGTVLDGEPAVQIGIELGVMWANGGYSVEDSRNLTNAAIEAVGEIQEMGRHDPDFWLNRGDFLDVVMDKAEEIERTLRQAGVITGGSPSV